MLVRFTQAPQKNAHWARNSMLADPSEAARLTPVYFTTGKASR
jgi:hypothetical protein